MSDTTSFADKYKTHAFHDLIEEAEKQGIALGVEREKERIIKLLEKHTHPEAAAEYLIDCNLCERYYGVGSALALIKGKQQ